MDYIICIWICSTNPTGGFNFVIFCYYIHLERQRNSFSIKLDGEDHLPPKTSLT